jgi:membrane-bound lytic murein transglycosylase F
MTLSVPYKKILLLFSILLVAAFVLDGCRSKKKPIPSKTRLERILERDTLNAILLYGSSSYFIYKDQQMGYDYDLSSNLADTLGVHLNVVVAKNIQDAFHLLTTGKGDVIASPVYKAKNTGGLLFTDVTEQSKQVLVQYAGKEIVNDVTQLVGQEVYVKADARYLTRMRNLSQELGGSVKVKEVGDSISMDKLIAMVASGKIRFAVASNTIADMCKKNLSDIDVHLDVSFPQFSSWVVADGDQSLFDRINQWYASALDLKTVSSISDKYNFDNKFFVVNQVRIPRGSISPYDRLFKRYAKQLGWRWQLLASQAYHESNFDANCVSWSGASGLMQLMPSTAEHYGVDKSEIFDPEHNIEAAVQYIKMLNMTFHEIANKDERVKFILASYHSGPGHVLDAMALAKKYGKNDHLWAGNVEKFLRLKSQAQYYNDEVCKNGYFNAKLTTRYVSDVMRSFESYQKRR